MNERILTGDASMFTPADSVGEPPKTLLTQAQGDLARRLLFQAGIDPLMFVAWQEATTFAEEWAGEREDEGGGLRFGEYVEAIAEDRDGQQAVAEVFFDNCRAYAPQIEAEYAAVEAAAKLVRGSE